MDDLEEWGYVLFVLRYTHENVCYIILPCIKIYVLYRFQLITSGSI
jgi:hypothetical protein